MNYLNFFRKSTKVHQLLKLKRRVYVNRFIDLKMTLEVLLKLIKKVISSSSQVKTDANPSKVATFNFDFQP